MTMKCCANGSLRSWYIWNTDVSKTC